MSEFVAHRPKRCHEGRHSGLNRHQIRPADGEHAIVGPQHQHVGVWPGSAHKVEFVGEGAAPGAIHEILVEPAALPAGSRSHRRNDDDEIERLVAPKDQVEARARSHPAVDVEASVDLDRLIHERHGTRRSDGIAQRDLRGRFGAEWHPGARIEVVGDHDRRLGRPSLRKVTQCAIDPFGEWIGRVDAGAPQYQANARSGDARDDALGQPPHQAFWTNSAIDPFVEPFLEILAGKRLVRDRFEIRGAAANQGRDERARGSADDHVCVAGQPAGGHMQCRQRANVIRRACYAAGTEHATTRSEPALQAVRSDRQSSAPQPWLKPEAVSSG